ncbi:branched-chain amino acid ABC transporter permease [Bradyrhizobium sp.]|jgi:branched-chain amino acid transport system permease protein|uniref:branched-chain amino acid ABC transporter permease n=1 Tax=Bradyrhizobium sp. TaxID=376 RepID=UPI003D1424CA
MRRHAWAGQLGTGIGILMLGALALLPALASRYSLFVAAQMLAFLYIALALEISHSFGRVLSFCTGTFFALGAYCAFYLCQHVTSELTLVLLGSAAVCAVAGLVTAIPVVRMKGAHSAVVGTLAIGAISLLIAGSLTTYTGGEDGLTLRHTVSLFGAPAAIGVSVATYYLVLVPAALYLLTYLLLRTTPFGTVMRAIGENEIRSAQLGFNVELRRIFIFAASTAVSGFGGAAYCILVGHVSTALFDPLLSLNAVLWATVGGLGSPFGALIGIIVIYPTVEFASGVIRYVDALVGALLIGTALLCPHGVMGLFGRLADTDQSAADAPSESFESRDKTVALSPGE